MIAGLHGVVFDIEPDAVLLDVSGVIYRVGTSARSLDDIGGKGEAATLRTHLIVREDILALYGFTSGAELALFETLIAVSGIGPRLACAVLSTLSIESLPLAIAEGDVELLSTVPGVGKKTAARIVVELRGKLPDIELTPTYVTSEDRDTVAALRSLGYTAAEANTAVAKLPFDASQTPEDRLLSALREVSS